MWMLVLVVVLSGCSRGTVAPSPGPVGHVPADRSTAQPVAMPAHKLTAGEVLFLRHCAGCHGAGARGDGPVGTVMGLRPRNLREAGLFPEERDTAWIVRILHGKAMPVSMQSSSTIATDREVDALAYHLRRLPTIPWNDVDRGVVKLERRSIEQKKTGVEPVFLFLVLRARLELARITPHAPQTCAATNYAT